MSVEQVGEITQGTVIMLACGFAAPAERVDRVKLLFERGQRLVCSPAGEDARDELKETRENSRNTITRTRNLWIHPCRGAIDQVRSMCGRCTAAD